MLLTPLLLPLFFAGAPTPQDDAPTRDELPPLVQATVGEWVRARSDYPARVGTWYAGEYGLEGLVPDLIERLRYESGRAENISNWTLRTVLDTLIRLDAEVPAEVLMAGLDDELLTETLLLLARDPDTNADAILALMDHGEPGAQHRWAAAAVLLATHPPGLARRLVEKLDLCLTLVVRDPGSSLSSHQFGGGSGGRWSTSHEFFPPLALYYLHSAPRRGAVAAQQARHGELVERLCVAGLVTRDEARGLSPHITLITNDLREGDPDPLPADLLD